MRDYPESIPVPYRIENTFPRGRVAFGGVKTAALDALPRNWLSGNLVGEGIDGVCPKKYGY